MKMNAVTICGSLREGSSNAKFIDAFIQCAPSNIAFSSLDTLGALPLYNPDIDKEPLPDKVLETRQTVRSADVLVFSTPEYIHSLPAALKNLLEWLVSDPEFLGKQVIILHANRSSTFALSELREVLRTMSAKIIEEACVVVDLGSNKASVEQILQNDDIKARLVRSAAHLNSQFVSAHTLENRRS